MEAMVFGQFGLAFLVIAIFCICYKKPIWGLVSSIAAMGFTYLTGCYWREMLISSGKDPTLLGFHRYPAPVIILAALMITALVVLIISIIRLAKRTKSKNAKKLI